MYNGLIYKTYDEMHKNFPSVKAFYHSSGELVSVLNEHNLSKALNAFEKRF
jgi:hypothetical protein